MPITSTPLESPTKNLGIFWILSTMYLTFHFLEIKKHPFQQTFLILQISNCYQDIVGTVKGKHHWISRNVYLDIARMGGGGLNAISIWAMPKQKSREIQWCFPNSLCCKMYLVSFVTILQKKQTNCLAPLPLIRWSWRFSIPLTFMNITSTFQ